MVPPEIYLHRMATPRSAHDPTDLRTRVRERERERERDVGREGRGRFPGSTFAWRQRSAPRLRGDSLRLGDPSGVAGWDCER
jgi:hypothetical protein